MLHTPLIEFTTEPVMLTFSWVWHDTWLNRLKGVKDRGRAEDCNNSQQMIKKMGLLTQQLRL